MHSYKLILITISLLIFNKSYGHGHHDHSWLEDSSAYEYSALHKKILDKNLQKVEIRKELKLSNKLFTEITESFLKDKLEQFTGETDVDLGATIGLTKITERKSKKGRSRARAFLTNEFRKIGFTVSENKFFRGVNLIAEKKSKLPGAKVLVLTAHYDSVGNPGANDNGSGVIGSLAIASALSSMEFKHDIRIIAFDKEETGLVGSKRYVKSLSSDERSRIIGNINFEMMGTNSRNDGAFHIIDCNRGDSKHLTKAVLDTIEAEGISLANNPGCTNRSDHASFWNANIPAIVISENFFGGDSDRCYHKKCDIVDERMNFTYMKNITHAIYGAMIRLLNE